MLAAGPGPAGHYGIGEATDLYLLGFYPVTSGLCCGTVHHPGGGKKKESLLDSVAMSLAKPQPRAHMRALIKNPVVFLCLLLRPLWSFVSIHSRGQVQVCSLAFVYVGSDLYLSIP